jgi:hypothetical protein
MYRFLLPAVADDLSLDVGPMSATPPPSTRRPPPRSDNGATGLIVVGSLLLLPGACVLQAIGGPDAKSTFARAHDIGCADRLHGGGTRDGVDRDQAFMMTSREISA